MGKIILNKKKERNTGAIQRQRKKGKSLKMVKGT